MSVDTVNQSLTRVFQMTYRNREVWSLTGYRGRLLIMDTMRSFLMDEDAEGFIRYVQDRLGTHADAMAGILEDLFEDLLGNPQAVWEEFEAELRAG